MRTPFFTNAPLMRTVLVIEKSDFLRRQISRAFERADYLVQEAETPEQALAMIGPHFIQAVIVDITNCGPAELEHYLQLPHHFPQVDFVATHAPTEDSPTLEILSRVSSVLNVRHLFKKPVTPSVLLDAVITLMKERSKTK